MDKSEAAGLVAKAAACAKVAPGPWDADSERQDDAPDRHNEYALFDERGYRLCGTENADFRFGLIEIEYDEDGSSAWNEPSRVLTDYLASVSPPIVQGLLATITHLTAEVERMAPLEGICDALSQNREALQRHLNEQTIRAESAETTISRLEAENAALREGLKPLAELVANDSSEPNTIWPGDRDDWTAGAQLFGDRITVGMVRRAAALLAKPTEEPKL